MAYVFIWSVAIALCSAEPFLDHHHSPANDAESHADDGDHPDSDQHHNSGHDDVFCQSLQTIDHAPAPALLVKPELSAHIALDFLWVAAEFTMPVQTAPISRGSPRYVWVFTPEVYLGPAFHSLAPPVPA